MKYLIVLSLLLVSCRADISDIMQIVEQEYNLTCIPSYEVQQEQIQCLHNSVFIEDSNYAECYNSAMRTYNVIMYEIQFAPHKHTRSINDIIVDCANKFPETTIQALNHCHICTEDE